MRTIDTQAARVLIAGGGVAGVEAVAGPCAIWPAIDAAITVVGPEDSEFLYKPLTVEEPFTGEPAERHELRPMLAEIGVRYVNAGDPRRGS